jgi:hypothetical protein
MWGGVYKPALGLSCCHCSALPLPSKNCSAYCVPISCKIAAISINLQCLATLFVFAMTGTLIQFRQDVACLTSFFVLIQQDLQSFSSLSVYSFCLIRLVRQICCFARSGSCISLCNVRQYCLFRQDVAYLTLFCTYPVDSCIILSRFGKFVSRQDWPTPQKNFGSNGAECSVFNMIL